MVIVWTEHAISSLKQVFLYHCQNANEKVAHKIRRDILETTHLLTNSPRLGQIESALTSLGQGYRYLLAKKKYKIIYRIEDESIIINDVFDVRQNPSKIKNNL